VRFLLDQNLSPLVAEFLREAGHDVVHVRDLGFAAASDRIILDAAATQERTIISADTDFGELLAETNASTPSFILLRRQDRRRARQIALLILANLDAVVEDLEAGAVVVLDDARVRVRRLPIKPA
jgi:predicted nuclease of predicted toxin-antitoxin system